MRLYNVCVRACVCACVCVCNVCMCSMQCACVCVQCVHVHACVSLLVLYALFTVEQQRLEPIPLANFSEHVAAMHKDRDLGFEEEYSVCCTYRM